MGRNKAVVIVDYGAGNLRSVINAIAKLGYHSRITSDPSDMINADAVILPGVGAAADTMANLKRLGLAHMIGQFIAEGHPFLGVCIGLQILFTDTEEKRPLGFSETLKVLRRKVHQTLKRVTHDFENFEFNTIISSLMELLNEMYKAREAGAVGTPEWDEATEIYLKMMAPVAPHITEELWTNHMGKPYSIHQQRWTQIDEAAAKEDMIEIPVQVNGKVRDRVMVAADASEEEIKSAALASEIAKKYLEGKEPKKIIVAQKRLVNIVT